MIEEIPKCKRCGSEMKRIPIDINGFIHWTHICTYHPIITINENADTIRGIADMMDQCDKMINHIKRNKKEKK